MCVCMFTASKFQHEFYMKTSHVFKKMRTICKMRDYIIMIISTK